jgi:hypothetical protein
MPGSSSLALAISTADIAAIAWFINQSSDIVNAGAVAEPLMKWPPFRTSMTALLSSTFHAYIGGAGASRIWR